MKVEAFNGIALLNSAAANDFLFLTLTAGPTLNFTATSTSIILRFTDMTTIGNSAPANWGLDTVTVQSNQAAVPEPGTLTLLIAGLGTLLVSKGMRGISPT